MVEVNDQLAYGCAVFTERSMPTPQFEDLPCSRCSSPKAWDVRHAFGSGAFVDGGGQWSPGGLPLMCCRIKTAGVIGGDTNVQPQSSALRFVRVPAVARTRSGVGQSSVRPAPLRRTWQL